MLGFSMKQLVLFLFVCFSFNNLNADPYKPLPLDFLDKTKITKEHKKPSNPKSKKQNQVCPACAQIFYILKLILLNNSRDYFLYKYL